MSLITLNNVSKTYDSGTQPVEALKDIDLTITHNEFCAIIGESGSGKSTLLNILGLLDRPTAGSYLLDEKETSNFSDDALSTYRNQKIGFVFQSFCLLPRLTALQNVALPLLYRDVDHKIAHQKAKEQLDQLGVLKIASHKPSQMSGGQQQRVAIARALINQPEILLADEPTGALDSQTSDEIVSLFHHLHQKINTTIIIITHNLEIARQCPRCITIKDGKIIQDAEQT